MTEPRYRIVNRLHVDHDAEIARLIAGLRATPATIEPKYFYDDLRARRPRTSRRGIS